MKIYGFREYGPASVLEFIEVEPPALQPGTVLVRPVFMGVNPADIKVRNGQRQDSFPVEFPMAMGREACGVVIDSDPEHPNAQRFSPGDWVFGLTAEGTGAITDEAVILNADCTALLPEGVPAELAVHIPVAAATAWDALEEFNEELGGGSLRDKTLLILGAGGGVGTHAIQLARHLGMKVIGATSGEDKVRVMNRYGAKHVATNDAGWVRHVEGIAAELPSGQVDAIFDLVGGDTLRAAAETMRTPIRSVADPDTAEEFGGRAVTRRRTTAVFEHLGNLLAANEFTPRVREVFPFSSAAAAYELLESGHAEGNIAIRNK